PDLAVQTQGIRDGENPEMDRQPDLGRQPAALVDGGSRELDSRERVAVLIVRDEEKEQPDSEGQSEESPERPAVDLVRTSLVTHDRRGPAPDGRSRPSASRWGPVESRRRIRSTREGPPPCPAGSCGWLPRSPSHSRSRARR